MSKTMAPFGIYVHWPFCLSKCPYCDFNSHVRERVDQDRWRRAMLCEIDHTAKDWDGGQVTSIFFGGGTPSLMPPETVAAIIEQIDRCWGLAEDVEITAEANPTSVESARFSALQEAGVNRVSLGVQAFDDQVLSFLGRGHSAKEAIDAIEIAAAHFGRYSFDLIYARPGQTLSAWHQELDRALALAGSHLSLYQLTVERGTPFYGLWRQGRLVPLDDDEAAEMFEATQLRLSDADLPAYEISNHAAPGAECRTICSIGTTGITPESGPAHMPAWRKVAKSLRLSDANCRKDGCKWSNKKAMEHGTRKPWTVTSVSQNLS
ncbi:MAG: radical SAM family heme chaperone HemW [Pseudomonadota bacterium]|nr:radical SAM family heme chaperone HemW [Pseudomonadota bacterium]